MPYPRANFTIFFRPPWAKKIASRISDFKTAFLIPLWNFISVLCMTAWEERYGASPKEVERGSKFYDFLVMLQSKTTKNYSCSWFQRLLFFCMNDLPKVGSTMAGYHYTKKGGGSCQSVSQTTSSLLWRIFMTFCNCFYQSSSGGFKKQMRSFVATNFWAVEVLMWQGSRSNILMIYKN